MKNNQKYFESCPLCGANDHIENHIPEEYERKYLDKKLTFDDLEETLRSGNIEELREIVCNYVLPFRLTSKQFEVAKLMLENKTQEEMAQILGISRRAVRERMDLIQRKSKKIQRQYEMVDDIEFLRSMLSFNGSN